MGVRQLHLAAAKAPHLSHGEALKTTALEKANTWSYSWMANGMFHDAAIQIDLCSCMRTKAHKCLPAGWRGSCSRGLCWSSCGCAWRPGSNSLQPVHCPRWQTPQRQATGLLGVFACLKSCRVCVCGVPSVGLTLQWSSLSPVVHLQRVVPSKICSVCVYCWEFVGAGAQCMRSADAMLSHLSHASQKAMPTLDRS